MVAACAALLCHGEMIFVGWGAKHIFESDRSSPGFPLKCKTWPFSWIFYKSRLSDEVSSILELKYDRYRSHSNRELSTVNCALQIDLRSFTAPSTFNLQSSIFNRTFNLQPSR